MKCREHFPDDHSRLALRTNERVTANVARGIQVVLLRLRLRLRLKLGIEVVLLAQAEGYRLGKRRICIDPAKSFGF